MGKKQIQLITRVSIILIPTYSVAFVTEAMIYTMPMLAACTLVAANFYDEKENMTRSISYDNDGDPDLISGAWLYPNQNGQFGSPIILSGVELTPEMSWVDWDGDGDIDLDDRTFELSSGIPSSVVPIFTVDGVYGVVGVEGGSKTLGKLSELDPERSHWYEGAEF